MSKNKFPQEVFVTRETGDEGADDFFLVSETLEGAFDSTFDAGEIKTIATYKLIAIERVKSELVRQ